MYPPPCTRKNNNSFSEVQLRFRHLFSSSNYTEYAMHNESRDLRVNIFAVTAHKNVAAYIERKKKKCSKKNVDTSANKKLFCGSTPKDVNFCGCHRHVVNCGEIRQPGVFCTSVGERLKNRPQRNRNTRLPYFRTIKFVCKTQ